VGRRYANLVCKKADVDMNKRAGELNDEEVSAPVAKLVYPLLRWRGPMSVYRDSF
jgi:ribosomal protein S13